jgi:hypothetical protein
MANLDAASASMRLTGRQIRALHQAALHAFRSVSPLEQCLLFNMDVRLNQIARSPANVADQVFDLLEWAEAMGRLREMMSALRECRPHNQVLAAAVADVFPGHDLERDDLEKIVVANPELFVDTAGWRKGMREAEWTVCRVERPEGKAWGTGFLVGRDMLLTNHHVRDAPHGDFDAHPTQVRCRFGFREESENDAGDVVRLSADWLVAESPTNELDYTLVRLSEPAGDHPIGTFKGAPKRGWLTLVPQTVAMGQALFILQHPVGDTLKMANGGLKRIDGDWLEYEVNTDHGSSGSPVFDNAWQVVALHSRFGKTDVNKGVKISSILDDVKANGIAL